MFWGSLGNAESELYPIPRHLLFFGMRASVHTSTSSVSVVCRPLARAFRRSAANSASHHHQTHRRKVVASAQTPTTSGFSAFDRVSILSEALPYLQRFRGKTVVVRTRRLCLRLYDSTTLRLAPRASRSGRLARSLAPVRRNSHAVPRARFLPGFLPFVTCR